MKILQYNVKYRLIFWLIFVAYQTFIVKKIADEGTLMITLHSLHEDQMWLPQDGFALYR